MLSKFKMSSMQCIDWLSIQLWCSIYNTRTHTRAPTLRLTATFSFDSPPPYSVFPRFFFLFQFMADFIGYRYLLLSRDTLMDRRKWLLIGWGRGASADWYSGTPVLFSWTVWWLYACAFLQGCILLSCKIYPLVFVSDNRISLRQWKRINWCSAKFELDEL